MPDERFEFPEFDLEKLPAKPENWAPDWTRWQSVLHGVRREKARADHLQKQYDALVTKAREMETSHAAALGSIRTKAEDAEVRGIKGLAEPDPAVFRSQHAAAMAGVDEAKRKPLVEWITEQMQAEERPRWLAGYIDEAFRPEPAGEQPRKQEQSRTRIPYDATRQPPPAPKSGFTPEEIAAMPVEEYKARKAAGQFSMRVA